MPTKTYNIQIVWNEIDGVLAHVDGKIEWDRHNPQVAPRLLLYDGTKVKIDRKRLKEVGGDGPDFIYECPGYTPPKRKR